MFMSASALPYAQAYALDDNALPQGGNVVGGSASFDYTNPGTLNVHQNTNRVVIDWNSFNIGRNATTQFYQPGSGSVAVNRVTGDGDPTQILGTLRSNGIVMVLDKNGVIFGRDSVIDVGGIVASTGHIDTTAFMNGDNLLTLENVDTGGMVINAGHITVAEAGLAAFVAPTVVNNNIIQAKLGRVTLASGTKATLDLYGDGLVEIAPNDAAQHAIVENAGIIAAKGGTVVLTAGAAQTVVNSIVNNSGIIQATSVSQKDGKIILGTGDTGVTINTGVLDVSGREEKVAGGSVKVLGQHIILDEGSLIDASGYGQESDPAADTATMTADKRVKTEDEFMADVRRGGGSIMIGGDYLGTGDTPHAQTLYVDANTLTLNDALEHGDGGRTIFWSDQITDFNGLVLARGGELSGNGGFLETSGKINLRANGFADLSAVDGYKKGSYLLDPADITIYGNVDPAFVSTDGTSVNLAAALGVWFDVSDTANVTLTYSNNGFAAVTATGTAGASTITTSADISAQLAVGARIRLNGAGAVTTANTVGADTYTITAIAGQTITISGTLSQNYTGVGVYRGLVSGLTDKSNGANSATQTTAANMPLWVSGAQNGQAVMYHNGSQYLNFSDAGLASGATSGAIFTVANNPTSATGWSALIGYGSGVDGNERGIGIPAGSNNLTVLIYGTDYQLPASYAVGPGYSIAEAFFTGGTTLSGTLNGGTLSSAARVYNTVLSEGRIGAQINPWVTQAWNGNIGESLIYNSALPTEARNLVEQYQSTKWGIALDPLAGAGTEAAEAMASTAKGDASNGFGVFTTDYLEKLSNTADIILAADNTITMDFKGDTLNLADNRSISLTTTTGNIRSVSNGTIQTNRTAGAGNITMTSGADIDLSGMTLNAQNGGTVTLTSGAGGMITTNRAITAGNVTLKGDEINLGANITTNNAGAAQLSTKTLTNEIEIGSTNAAALNLTATELGYLQDGWSSITIGDSSHNASITVNEALSFSDTTYIINSTAFQAGVNRTVDINSGITTTDNADLYLTGYNTGGGGPHNGIGVHVGADLDVSGNLTINSAAQGFFAQTNSVVAGGNIYITSNSDSILDTNFTAGGNFTFFKNGHQDLTISSNRTINAGGNISLTTGNDALNGIFRMNSNSALRADGNITLTSGAIVLDSTASLAGNADGSSILTFREVNDNAAMELGGTAVGSAWQMTDAELATIDSNFSKVIFGSASMTGDISIQTWDLSSKAFDVEVYGNDIDLAGLTMGAGNFLAHAIDNAAIDAGDLTVSANITRAVNGGATLDLRADQNILNANGADIIASDANSDADGNPETDADSLTVILNADRDGDQDGAIYMDSFSATTMGGNFIAGGGADPLLGYAYGNATYKTGTSVRGSVTTNGGDIILRGHGYNNSAGDHNIGVDLYSGTLTTTSGDVNVAGIGGDGIFNNYGIYARKNISTVTGAITLTGTGGADQDTDGAGPDTKQGTSDNYGIYFAHGAQITSTGTGASVGAITLNGTGGAGTSTNYGIYFRGDSGTRLSVADADVLFTGRGGHGSSSSNYGIVMGEGAILSSAGTGANAATIALNGTGGNGEDNNYGVYISGSGTKITSVEGDITVTGQGGSNGGADSDSNFGIFMQSAAQISSTGTGADAANISLNGTGGAGDDGNYGVGFAGSNTKVTTVDGAINITGIGGSAGGVGSNTNYGIFLGNAAADLGVYSTGTGANAGTITLNGTGGNGEDDNYGIYLIDAGTRITSVEGNISVTGQGGSNGGADSNNNFGMFLQSGAQILSSGVGANAATIALSGTGGNGASSNYGMYVTGAGTSVSSTDGAISIVAQGRGVAASNYGLYISGGALFSSTGTGANAATITLNGTGGLGTGNALGIYLQDATTAIQSVDGDILLTGQGGGTSGNGHSGIHFYDGATITSSGTTADAALITLNGTGGVGGGVGISMNGGTLTSGYGDIDMTGSGSGIGIYMSNYLTAAAQTKVISTGIGDDAANITMNGTSASQNGVFFHVGAAATTVDGDIDITGSGHGRGVYLRFGSNVQSTGTGSNAGNITIHGTGLNGAGSQHGVDIGQTSYLRTVDGNIQVTGQGGNSTNDVGHGFTFTDAASGYILTTGAGDVTIDGTAGNCTLGSCHGVNLLNSTNYIRTDSTGDINITGVGGSTGGGNHGINISGGAVISSTLASSTAGGITLNGTGGDGAGGNLGIVLGGGNSTISSAATGAGAKSISLTGIGGNGTGGGNAGVRVTNGGDKITSVDSDIVINGTGRGAGGTGYGVQIFDGYVRTSGTGANAGNINITGIGASAGNNNYGVTSRAWNSPSGELSTVDGDITVSGTGGTNSGTNNHGIYLQSGGSAIPTIWKATGDGNMTLTGISGPDASAQDLFLENTGQGARLGDASMTGDITLNVNTFASDASNPITTQGNILIKPRTASTSIGLGGGAGILNLTDAELANFSAGNTFMIGDSALGTGDVDIDSWDLSGKSHHVQVFGNDIDLGGIMTGAKDVYLYAKGGDITVSADSASNAAGNLTLLASDNVLVNEDIINAGAGHINIFAGWDSATGITTPALFNLDDVSLDILARDITLGANGRISSGGAGTSVLLVASDDFINNSTYGVTAISAAGGRYLVYSDSPTETIKGGLTAKSIYNKNYNDNPTSDITGATSRFVYKYQPTLTFSANNVTLNTFDTNYNTFSYSTSGLINGDMAADVFSGVPLLGKVRTGASTYAITVSQNTLLSLAGYKLKLVNGLLTLPTLNLGDNLPTYVANSFGVSSEVLEVNNDFGLGSPNGDTGEVIDSIVSAGTEESAANQTSKSVSCMVSMKYGAGAFCIIQ